MDYWTGVRFPPGPQKKKEENDMSDVEPELKEEVVEESTKSSIDPSVTFDPREYDSYDEPGEVTKDEDHVADDENSSNQSGGS